MAIAGVALILAPPGAVLFFLALAAGLVSKFGLPEEGDM